MATGGSSSKCKSTSPENNHLLTYKGSLTVQLDLFPWFGLDQTNKTVVNLAINNAANSKPVKLDVICTMIPLHVIKHVSMLCLSIFASNIILVGRVLQVFPKSFVASVPEVVAENFLNVN